MKDRVTLFAIRLPRKSFSAKLFTFLASVFVIIILPALGVLAIYLAYGKK